MSVTRDIVLSIPQKETHPTVVVNEEGITAIRITALKRSTTLLFLVG